MLADGGHISIDGVEYVLAIDEENHYTHRFESLFAPAQAIAGEIAKDQIRPEKLLWAITDWSGGEGGRIFYEQIPNKYDYASLMNPTVRGQLTTRPRRYRSSVARSGSNADTGHRPVGTSANRHALIGWEDNIINSSNAISWVATQDTTTTASGVDYAAAITDGVNAGFLKAADGAGSADKIGVVQADTSVIAWIDAHTGTTNPAPPTVGAVVDGVPYTFGLSTSTGVLQVYKKAAIMDSAADWVGSTIYSTNIDVTGSWGNDYWTSATGAETALFVSFSTRAQGFIWEIRNDVGRPFWTAPLGFVIKTLIYQGGILFILGNTMSGGRQFATIWAIPLQTGNPIIAAEPRKHQNTEFATFDVGCAGPGNSLFCADAASGKIFVYDIENDALHLFDDLANGGTGDGMSFASGYNLLTINQTSLETDFTGWAGESTDTAVRSVTFAYHGAASASWSPAIGSVGTTAGIVTSTGTSGVNVAASTQYTASAYIRNDSGAENVRISIRWYSTSGSLISTSNGSNVASSTTFQQVTCTATSPSTAVYAAVYVENPSVTTHTITYYTDAITLTAGSSTSTADSIAFLAMHGTRLFGATWQPTGIGTSLQVFTYDDMQPDNRDSSQSISATAESPLWDNGLPMEIKSLNGFVVSYKVTDSGTTSGLIANSRITVSYSIDDAAYVATTTITSATTPSGSKGRVYVPVSTGSSTVKYTRLKVKVALDNNSTAGVAPPLLYGVTVDSQPMAYSQTWDLIVRVEDEQQNERPGQRQNEGAFLRDSLITLATQKEIVTLLDGYRYHQPNRYTTHTITVEDPTDIIVSEAEGLMRIRLREVAT